MQVRYINAFFLSRNELHIALNSYLPSLLKGLQANGVNIDYFINKSYLKDFNLFNPNGYIPSTLLDKLLISISNKLGVRSPAYEFREFIKATEMGSVSLLAFQSPSFLTLLRNVVTHDKIVRTNFSTSLEIFGAYSRFAVKINEADSWGKRLSEEVDIRRIIDAFTLVNGEDFVPSKIGITSNKLNGIETILPEGDFEIRTKQNESWILFPTSLLSKQVPQLVEGNHKNEWVEEPNSSSFKIEKLIESYVIGNIPTLNEIANSFETSRRTLERKLAWEGTSFLQIKENYIQRLSFELLENPNLSIQEISQQLDYLHSQNFIRCFKKWTGTTPDEYRRMKTVTVAK